MLSDRYMPDADEHDLAPSPRRSSHREGTRPGGQEEAQQHESRKHRSHKHKSKRGDKHHRHREASVEDVEDGEIVEPQQAAGGEGSPAEGAAAAGRSADENGVTKADAAANGKHRYPADGADEEAAAPQDR